MNARQRFHFAAAIATGAVLAGVLLLVHASAEGDATVTVDPAVRFQTIDGWQVYPRYWEHDKVNNRFDASFAPLADEISAFLVDRVGINGARVEIWSGLENPVDHWTDFYEGRATYQENKEHRYEKINDNDDPFAVNPSGFQFARFDYRFETMVQPLIRAMERRGERLLINVNYVDFEGGSQGSLSHAENPEEYAEFVLVFFERLRARYGVIPDSFEIVLEPDNTEGWRGEEVGRALVAVQRRLAAHGFEPEFIAPSTASMPNASAYFDAMAEVPGALAALDVLAYHRYGIERTSDLVKIRERATAHGLKTAMLEKVGAGIDQLIEDLTLANVSSWQQWAVAGLDDWEGGAFYLLVDPDAPGGARIRMAERSDQLAHVFRYVRRGAVRVAASSLGSGRPCVAFVNPDGRLVAVIRAGKRGGALTLKGLPAGRYGMVFTGDDRATSQLPEVSIVAGQDFVTDLPGPGVLTVHGL
jgi:hypothetical protein